MTSITILAAQMPDTGVPWWWHAVFVPAAIGVLSSLLSFLAGLYLLTGTELYRRLARWEPYGREMWLRQVAIYSVALKSARSAMETGRAYAPAEASEEWKGRLRGARAEAFTKLGAAEIEASILLPKDFSEPYTELLARVRYLADMTEEKSALTPEQAQDARRTWIDMQIRYRDLLKLARKHLNTEALSEKTIEAIASDLKNPFPEKRRALPSPHPNPLPKGEGTGQQPSP
jgi:hypothetical protein